MIMQFTKKKLSNGITLLHEKRELPVVSLGIANRYGASFEPSSIKGVAHFIEHLLFTGTQTRTHEDISREIEKRGGILNAYTSNDVTCYWFKIPSEHLFVGLTILADMLNNPRFDLEKFEKEKKVILEEIKMYHDVPQRNIYDKLVENLYQAPFGEGIIGSEATVSALSRDFVAETYKKMYNPENYIVTVVGNCEVGPICDFLEKNFKATKKKLDEPVIKTHHRETVEERPGIDQAHFIFGIHAPLMDEKTFFVLEVLDAYLANGMSSKLFLKIREEKGLAYSVNSSINTEKRSSYYSIYAGTTKEAVPEVKRLILEGFDEVKNMTQKDLDEAKDRLSGLRQIAKEDSSTVMNELLFAELCGKAEDYYQREELIRKVTLAEVKKLAQLKEFSSAAIVPKTK